MSPLSKQGKVAVGYQFWSNSNPGCASARQDNYRGLAGFDLATLRARSTPTATIQSLIIGANIRLIVQGGTPAPMAIGSCVPDFAGVGAVEQLRPGFTILNGLNRIAGSTTLAFPPGANATTLAGMAVPGTSGRVSASVGGLGLTVVDIDVKDLLVGALNRGDASFGIMLDGTSEAMLTPTGDPQADCRTLVSVGALEVKHL